MGMHECHWFLYFTSSELHVYKKTQHMVNFSDSLKFKLSKKNLYRTALKVT